MSRRGGSKKWIAGIALSLVASLSAAEIITLTGEWSGTRWTAECKGDQRQDAALIDRNHSYCVLSTLSITSPPEDGASFHIVGQGETIEFMLRLMLNKKVHPNTSHFWLKVDRNEAVDLSTLGEMTVARDHVAIAVEQSSHLQSLVEQLQAGIVMQVRTSTTPAFAQTERHYVATLMGFTRAWKRLENERRSELDRLRMQDEIQSILDDGAPR